VIPLAHGLLVGRQDLPIPTWLFAWGASLVLIASFVILSLAWHRTRYEADSWRPFAPRLSRLAVNAWTETLAGAIGVLLLVAVVWTGIEGTEAPDRNFAVTFVFVTFWLGGVVLSVLLGDFFRAFSPWRAIARVVAAVFAAVAGQPGQAPLRYPERLGRWPAVAGLVAFVWLELVYGFSGFRSVGLEPQTVAIASLLYSAYVLGGMALFGIETWSRRAETFSVYFGMFARISPLEVREGRLGWRRPLAGLSSWAAVPGSVALVLASIGTTTYDGAQEGPLETPTRELFDWLADIGISQLTAARVAETVFLALVLTGVALVYWAGVRGMRTVTGSPPLPRLGRAFAHSLVPIALAYLVAHYFSLVVFAEQAQFTYLLSDPLGDGSDLFGTAAGGIDYALLDANTIWYVQVGALLAGHVCGLVLAHDRALAVYGEPGRASLSQRWMLAVMVSFTCLGLFLLSQANA
jgi:hypothetical protein